MSDRTDSVEFSEGFLSSSGDNFPGSMFPGGGDSRGWEFSGGSGVFPDFPGARCGDFGDFSCCGDIEVVEVWPSVPFICL